MKTENIVSEKGLNRSYAIFQLLFSTYLDVERIENSLFNSGNVGVEDIEL